MDTKQVILVRKDLEMSPGKTAAQVAHASLMVFFNNAGFKHPDSDALIVMVTDEMKHWIRNAYTKVTLGVRNESQLMKHYLLAKEAGLPCSVVKDAGRTELDGENLTCVAIGPAECDKIDAITGKLQLFK